MRYAARGTRHFLFTTHPCYFFSVHFLLAQKTNQKRAASDLFWDIATVLKLAEVALSKQYCLTPSEARGSCIAGASRKTGAPKLSAALNFLWLLSLF